MTITIAMASFIRNWLVGGVKESGVNPQLLVTIL